MYKTFHISEFLHRKKTPISIEGEKEYLLITVKLHHKGVVLREKIKGNLIGSKMFRVSEGQFILSGIDARNGAFGVIPKELDGAIVTNDFWYFDVDENIIKREFFYWLTNTPLFLDACIKSSQGETQRIRLQKELFFNFQLHLPSVEDQESFLKRIANSDALVEKLNQELDNQSEYCTTLRQSILQEAIEGKLTAKWRKENPDLISGENHASKLLEKIKAEKEKLIKEGTINKEKNFTSVADKEKLFGLPQGWIWCRFGEIAKQVVDCPHATPTYLDRGKICLRASNIIPTGLRFNEKRFVSSEEYLIRTERLRPQKYDLVYIREGGRLGIAGIIDIDEECCLGQRLMLLRLFENATAIFSTYFVNSPIIYNSALDISLGSASPHVNVRDVISLAFPLPPLPEQQAIVDRVDKLMTLIDELEKQVSERKNLSEKLMQSVLQEAFE
jgi:type I restriction enzyme, S subunit